MTSQLRVAYDAGPLLDPPSGIPRYTSELLRRVASASDVDVRPFAVALGGDAHAVGSLGFDLARWRVPARVMRKAWRALDRPKIERLVGSVDIVHGTNFVLPPLRRAHGVVTVHDLAFLRDDVFPGGAALRHLVPWSVSRASKVLVPTHGVKAELTDRLKVPEDQIVVTHEGVSSSFFGATPLGDGALRELGVRPPFVLAVGTLEPRKNLALLLRAWDTARHELPGWTLVLTGRKGWGEELPPAPGVVLTGWVPEMTLPGLVAAADAFCFPSLYEGFGLPPLEAMAAGTPVIAARYSVAEEVLGDAAILVDVRDAEGFADALSRVGTDERLRRGMVVRGRARAATFSWDSTARETVAAYREVGSL